MKPKSLLLFPVGVMTCMTCLRASMAFANMPESGPWINVHVHSSVETLGAAAAIYIGIILLQHRHEKDFESLFWPGLGFLSMGIFDGFHALCSPGQAFVFLHSVAGLTGSIGFALVWISKLDYGPLQKNRVPWLVTAGTILLGIWSLVLPGTLPEMVHNGELTSVAIKINLFTGILFLIAATYFIKDLYHSGKGENYLFIFLAVLFSLAGLTFKYSMLWDDIWWLWQTLRLATYLLIMAFLTHAHRKMQQKLNENEIKLHTLYESFRDAVMLLDDKGFLDCNSATLKIFHCASREDFCSKHPGDLSPPIQPDGSDSVTLANEQIEVAMKQGSNRFEWVHRRMDGEDFPAEVLLNVMELNGHTVLQAMVVDITQLKLTQKNLNTAAAVFETMIDGVTITDLHGAIKDVNQATLAQHGYKKEELIGKTPGEMLLAERELPKFIQHVQQTASGETVKNCEYMAKRKDGSEFPIAVSLSIMISDDGESAGVVATHKDITEIKKTETVLEEAIEKSNQMAIEAEMASIAKSEFLANMSHEIRTPMNGVIGMTDLLLESDLDDKQRRYADIAKMSAESLLELINDILDFSKIEAGKLDIEEIDFDLRMLLKDFAFTMSLRTEEKGLEFICHAAPEVPTFLKGDPGRLRQILINLTGNAIKFTEKGEVAVFCRLEEELQNSCRLHFSVQDTGIGIPRKKQSILFEKFTQADGSTTRKFGGTGLGLAISKQLSGLMGGEIGIISEEGKGSTFWFTVEFKNSVKKSAPVETDDLVKAKILLIDDNTTSREVMGAILSSWNIEHSLAQSGKDGLEMLFEAHDKGNPFDIAVLDLRMPGMDGTDVGRAIKEVEKLKDTHLVLLTSMAGRGDATLCTKAGFDAFLSKPVQESDLYDCLAQVMGASLKDKKVKEPPLITRHSISEGRKTKTRLLLVDDNSTNRIVAKALLKKLGYSPDVAVNGLEAVKALKTTPYDLVFMDIQMPEMDGLEATRTIRNPKSDVLNHKIPIIAMTANAMKGDREICMEAGMDDYITKPIVKKRVHELLEKWLPLE